MPGWSAVAPAQVPTMSVDRGPEGLRYRLDRPAREDLEALQEEYLQRIDGAGLATLLSSADELLRHGARTAFAGEAHRRGIVLHRALVPEPLALQLRSISGPLLVRTSVYGIPWELLHDGEEFWGIRYALGRRLVTARPLGRRGEDAGFSLRPRALVIGADPRGDLRLVAEEVEALLTALASRLDVTCVAGPLAAFESVVDLLGQGFHVVHFAGHVVVGDAGGAGLLLGDGRVLASDVIAAALRGQPVVVLNGCGSVRAAGPGTDGSWEETLSGVAHGFLFGGALAVVGTLGEVSDRHAATMARAFYRHLLAADALGESLRRARHDLRADPDAAESPAWLSFVLYGNPALTVVSGDGGSPPGGRRDGAAPTRRHVVLAGAALAAGAAVAALARHWVRSTPVARPLVVGVMATRAAAGTVPDWMREFSRHAINTTLTEVAGVSVFSQEKIDFLCQSQGLCGIAGAEALGMAKMITPSLSVVGDRVALEVEVVDITRNGLLEMTERVQGPQARLIELQNTLVLRVLERLGIEPTPDARSRILGERTNDMLESYRMLVETLGGHAAVPLSPESRGIVPRWGLVAEARAEDAPAEAAVRAALEAYARALTAHDIDAVAALQVKLSEEQRSALERYFGHTANLEVIVSNVEVLVSGSQALATYVREDRFTDARTGRPVHLKVTLSSRFSKVDGAWRLDLGD